MSTYNLLEIVHNIWLQQFGKNVKCLFVVTSNDYVKVFRQSAFYKVYLNGGRCGEGPGKNELKLWQTSQFGDRSQMANNIAKHLSKSSFITRIPHLEGQEVFGSTKRKVDITNKVRGQFTHA